VGALLYWRSRGPAAPGPASPLVAASTPTADAPEWTVPTAPRPAPAAVAKAAPAPATPPPAAPTARSATAAPTPSKPPVAPGGRQKWLDRAARDRRKADGDRRARFTIQLELVCQEESLSDAWRHDRPSGTMWLLTTPFQGKTCFRVLWGRYPTREAAQRALSRAPAFFSTPRNRPLVVPIR
jgi:septal ring-binding cell division protein DamX